MKHHTRRGSLRSFVAATIFPLAVSVAPSIDARHLSFDERVRAQQAIEQVYWNHRVWPKENPGPKPPLSAVMPDAALRAKVEDTLRSSTLLDTLWNRPLTGEQLQAEIERMRRTTKAPGMLRELFAALDDDPFLIAECLARPILVDRLTRNWYARDARFHAKTRQEAEAALAGADDPTAMATLHGAYSEAEVDGTAEEWPEQVRQLATAFGVTDDELPVGRMSPLAEEDDRFVVTALLSKAPDRLRVATLSWEKRSFEAWWTEEGRLTTDAQASSDRGPVKPPAGGYRLLLPLEDGCVEGTWKPIWFAPMARARHTAVWTGTEMIVWAGIPFSTSGGRYVPATDSWTPTSTGAGVPSVREGAKAVWTGTEMIVWGGWNGTFLPMDGGRYDPANDRWTPTSTGPDMPLSRFRHSMVWTGTEMIVWGGYNGQFFDSGGRYDPTTDHWTPITAAAGAPSARDLHTAVWTGTEMIVWGGYNGGAYLDSGGRYDPANDSWTPTSTAAGVPSPRSNHTATWTGTAMVVWGGSGGLNAWVNSGARYNPTTDSWAGTSTAAGVPTARMDHTATWTGTQMVVWGGSGSGSSGLNTGARYDPTGDSWAPTSTAAGVPTGRSTHTAVWTGTEMVVWGGGSGTNTGGRYDPATDNWTPTSIGNGPAGKRSHTAVWTGTEMIVWGGVGPANPSNTGYRYDPALDSWTPTSTVAGVPSARTVHTAIWTGTEMIVWGGDLGTTGNTGARYNPLSNSWTPTSIPAGMPARMYGGHSAVWTGTEMIVWGGSIQGGDSNYGARYRPASDTWTLTSTAAGVPGIRRTHTAVWTGREMIVWGGRHTNTDLDSGGRYDPATDHWTATSTAAGVPSARSGHMAVWTGTKMIVWAPANAGGRYDPVTDQWTPTSTESGVPESRSNPSAVWTGREMVVWGGWLVGDRNLQTGGLYDPGTDGWTATSTAPGVPQERRSHTAVWTGREMIVWGGTLDGSTLNSGGLLCVCGAGAVSTWYPDADGDGYGLTSTGVPACEQPPGYIAFGGDCADFDSHCTTDCATDVDQDGLRDCSDTCLDGDGDGYGSAGGAGSSCVAPDCDDTVSACSTSCIDADDDGLRDCSDDGCIDVDRDGHGSAGGAGNSCIAPDCDDAVPSCTTDCTDADHDGFRFCEGDCDDGVVTVHPFAPERCNGVDDNCNNLIDDDASGEDSDGDAVHNACDNCPGAANPSQTDVDGDSAGDACDNCPLSKNPDQADTDDDAEGDLCDLDDGLIYLTTSRKDAMEWQNEQGFDHWNYYKGDLAVLKASGVYTQPEGSNPLATRACGWTTTFLDDPAAPPVGATAFVLVTGMAGGIESSLGTDSSGTERPNSHPCP